jgi:hypothetical protein
MNMEQESMKGSKADIATQNHTNKNYMEWKQIIRQYYPDLVVPAEICASVVAQLFIQDIVNPFSLVLMAPSATGKTTLINFFDNIDNLTYSTDAFSSASFVSNAANIRTEKLAEIDLLPRIKDKAFLVRDLSTIFSKREDILNEILGKLTRVLDGEGLSIDSGSHGRRNLTGSYFFVMLSATTPVSGRVWRMMGTLGSRLFFLNIQPRHKPMDELVSQVKSIAPKKKELLCREATKEMLMHLGERHPQKIEWNRGQDSDEVIERIVVYAKLLAKSRGVVNLRNEYKKQDNTFVFDFEPPIIESPDRLCTLFYNLCRGRALLCGRSQIGADDLTVVRLLAIDSAPPNRARLIRELIALGGKLTTSQVRSSLQCSVPSALKEMKTLVVLGVCEMNQVREGKPRDADFEINLASEFNWLIDNQNQVCTE